jgi:hypothetical protein
MPLCFGLWWTMLSRVVQGLGVVQREGETVQMTIRASLMIAVYKIVPKGGNPNCSNPCKNAGKKGPR